MQREGSNPENMQAEDFLCDFCERPWAEDRPMVEGHRGSIICGKCLAVAFAELWNRLGGELPPVGLDPSCVMCLARNEEAHWSSPLRDARICKRCTKQGAVMLERDPELSWKRPT